MEKIWYIFIENHHKGPFSAEDIFKMFHSDQLLETSLVWREGMDKWESLKNISELWSTLSPIPKLPSLPDTEELPPDLPLVPESPLPELPFSSAPHDQKELATVIVDSDIAPNNAPKSLFKNKKTIGFAVGLIAISCLVFVYFFGDSSSTRTLDWGNLPLLESERLKNITQVRLREGVKIGLAGLAKDQRIFMASNRSGPAVVMLELQSIPKRILGQEMVHFTSEAKLEGHYALFNQFKFINSASIIPGYYRVKLDATSFYPQRSIINQLIRWGILSKEAYSEKFVYRGELLIADMTPSRFEKELEAYYGKLADEAAFPYVDIKERYKTLHSFLEQLLSLYAKFLLESESGFNRSTLQKNYSSDLGHLFQVMVEDSYRLKEDYAKKRPHMVIELDEFLNLSTSVGQIFGEMLELTQKKASKDRKKIKKKVRDELLEYFTRKIEKIKKTIDAKQGELEQKIEAAKKI